MRRLLTWFEKGAGLLLAVAALSVLAAAAFGAYVLHAAQRRVRGPVSITASSSRSSIEAGSSAGYRISIIRQRGFRGRVELSIRGLPRHARARIAFRGRSPTRATVVVITSVRTPAGRYRLQLRGSDGPFSVMIRLTLTVKRPKFEIQGELAGLEPGVPQALNLSLTNPEGRTLSVTRLIVTSERVSSPRSTAKLPCTLADFAVRQFSGSYPLVLPRRSVRTLSSLGVPPARQPTVMLRDRPVDQDGCQRATLTLVYSGSAALRSATRRRR
jgi:hypothetical protein